MNDFIMSPTIGALAKALAAAQGEFKAAPKEAVNPHFKSRYADLAGITEASRESLAKHGLSLVQIPLGTASEPKMLTKLMHESGEYIGGLMSMLPQNESPQAVGSCITYMRRYARAAILGIAADDDDGNDASRPGQNQKSTHTPQPPMRAPAPTPQRGQQPSRNDIPLPEIPFGR